MSLSRRRCTIRFDRRAYERVIVFADEQGCNPSDVIRAAVDAYLGTANLITSSHRRLARVGEFMQLALDVIISEQYPELRERIIANTDRRLKQFQGA